MDSTASTVQRGLFITIEGVFGKSTQAQLLCDHFKRSDVEVHVVENVNLSHVFLSGTIQKLLGHGVHVIASNYVATKPAQDSAGWMSPDVVLYLRASVSGIILHKARRSICNDTDDRVIDVQSVYYNHCLTNCQHTNAELTQHEQDVLVAYDQQYIRSFDAEKTRNAIHQDIVAFVGI